MFRWYRQSYTCYVYLFDVPAGTTSGDYDGVFESSSWFRRGWTLQELLAPQHVVFCDDAWNVIGNLRIPNQVKDSGREVVTEAVSRVTGIGISYLERKRHIYDASIAERMSWAASRTTSRIEDEAYCLLGLFNVNMPLIYGEGNKAFLRLQEEIVKRSTDLSILAWTCSSTRQICSHSSVFASSPRCFISSRAVGTLRGPSIKVTSRGLKLKATGTRLAPNIPQPALEPFRDVPCIRWYMADRWMDDAYLIDLTGEGSLDPSSPTTMLVYLDPRYQRSERRDSTFIHVPNHTPLRILSDPYTPTSKQVEYHAVEHDMVFYIRGIHEHDRG
jgi:hypothetical protein